MLWFDEPATVWQEHAFPIGNGSAGGVPVEIRVSADAGGELRLRALASRPMRVTADDGPDPVVQVSRGVLLVDTLPKHSYRVVAPG